MPTLQDIQHEIENVLQVADELGEDQEKALAYLDELGIQEESKIDAVSYAVRKRKAEIEFLKTEEKRLSDLRKAMENRLESFREYLRGIFLRHGLRKLKGRSSTVFLRDFESIEISDPTIVPRDFVKEIVTEKIDKALIKQTIQAGLEVPGVRLAVQPSLVFR